MNRGVMMHQHSFLAAGFATATALLFAAVPAVVRADWTVGGDAGRHNVPPPTTITPPGPFLQPSPDSYLYPRPVYPQPQQLPDHRQTWQQQWQERQWRESQWQEQQRSAQPPDWHDWGQHDRDDRGSREREGRNRDWHGRTEQGTRFDQDAPVQSGSDAQKNGPSWGYRDSRR